MRPQTHKAGYCPNGPTVMSFTFCPDTTFSRVLYAVTVL